jgi:glycosyltransferase involved in cell wall biosynthesis
MAKRGLRVVQVSSHDSGGGAAHIARLLHRELLQRGVESRLLVGTRLAGDSAAEILEIDAMRHTWRHRWAVLQGRTSKSTSRGRLFAHACRAIETPSSVIKRLRGHEDFDYPGSHSLIGIAREADVLHLHNLHGGYFDLELLPRLSSIVPTVVTLHDAWLMTGHCAHGMGCERWRIGCGQCPDLTIYPAVMRDATSYNWQRKRRIAAASALLIATPCSWLMEQVQASLLVGGMAGRRVIPNGVDVSVFKPADRAMVRAGLGLPHDAHIVVTVGFSMRVNPFKDFGTLKGALQRLGSAPRERKVIVVVIGDEGPSERFGDVELRFIGRLSEPPALAGYYQSADIYLHPARADTFPSSILEALACACPVVASAVGGIPEQVRSLSGNDLFEGGSAKFAESKRATGQLVAPSSAGDLAAAIERLLSNDSLRKQLAENAAQDARERFDQLDMIGAYAAWYEEIALGDALGRMPALKGGSLP